MKNKYLKPIYLISAIAIIAIFGYRVYQAKFYSEQSTNNPIPVSTIDVNKYQKEGGYIYSTGKIESLEQIDIKSELSAKVKTVNFKIGDKVKKGDIIIELENNTLSAQLSQAQAALNQRIAGATSEDIKIYETSVTLAKADLEKTKSDMNALILSYESALKIAKNNLMISSSQEINGEEGSNIVNNVYENLVNIIKSLSLIIENSVNDADKILGINNEYTNNIYENVLGVKDISTLNAANTSFYEAEKSKDYFLQKSKSLNNMTKDELKTFAEETKQTIEKINFMLNNMTNLLDATVTFVDFSENDLNALKGIISGDRAKINEAQRSITAGLQAIETSKTNLNAYQIAYEKAENDLENAKKTAENTIKIKETSYQQAIANLEKVKANPRDVDLASLRAIVAQSAAVYNKSIITSPFDGEISSMPFREGDLVPAGMVITGVVNKNGIQIKTYINPEERAKIKEGDKVIIEDEYEGFITNIAPSIDVSSKKIEIIIAITDDKSNNLTIGQYANIKIIIEKEANGIFIIPLSAVKVRNGESSVFFIDENGIVKEKQIKTGDILGDNIEVNDGLNPNDQIISSIGGITIGQEVIIK
jgi:RND family efflux transporter MFP subunit